MMTNNKLRKRKAPQFNISILVIFPALTGMLSSCNAVTNEVDFTLTPLVENPATEELTLVPETEVATATQTWTLTAEPSPTATATATETPRPTEVSLIKGNIFFDPQSEADFPMVVESPSPIDEPEKFAAWQDEYLKMIEEKLDIYTGSSIDASVTSALYESSAFEFASEDWPVIASYKFKWQGHEMLTKTFAVRNKNGNLIPLSVTYTTPDSLIFDSVMMYKTLSGGLFMKVYFGWNDRVKSLINDIFIDSYLSNSDYGVVVDAMRRFCAGTDTEADRKLISSAHLVVSKFN